jgi:ATP-dependent RNA helicase DDX1
VQAAETGSGKTGAFALPAIQLVHEALRAAQTANKAKKQDKPAAESGPAAAAAGKAAGVKLNVGDRSAMLAVAPDALTCQCRQEKDWGGVRATVGVTRGKFYFEASIRDEGLCRFGWATQAASLELGTDKAGFGFGGTGKKSNNKAFDAYGEAFGKGDVIGCCIDLSENAGSISWAKNGKHLGEGFRLPKTPAAVAFFPAICMKNAECQVNFGAVPFKFPPPAGYVAVDAAPAEVRMAGPGEGGSGSGGAGANGGKGGGETNGPVCLVLEPARDLAEQTYKAFVDMSKYVASPSVQSALVIGGVDPKEVKGGLKKGADVVVATPGKLVDIVEGKKLSLSQIRLLILDEADRFTDQENMAMVQKLYRKIAEASGGQSLQVCFFSATLHSPEIGKLSDLLCKHPTWVDLKGKESVPETVHHVIVKVDPTADRSWVGKVGVGFRTDGVHAGSVDGNNNKLSGSGARLSAEEASEGVKRLKQRMLVSLIDSLDMDQCIIFCRTNVDCDNLEAYLTEVGGGQKFRAGAEKGKENAYSCVVLAGMRGMDERRRNLEAFKSGCVRFLVCTDVAARGLDIKELPYVINMTLPDETENYIHRIGRVGRADRMGLAISLVATGTKEKVWFHKCANRGKGCNNTKLVDQGGCTIWYDEPNIFNAVKKRLHVDTLPEMSVKTEAKGPNGTQLPYLFTLPAGMADGVTYGEERGNKGGVSEHVEAIREQVSTLAALEVRAQNSYLALKLKYNGVIHNR